MMHSEKLWTIKIILGGKHVLISRFFLTKKEAIAYREYTTGDTWSVLKKGGEQVVKVMVTEVD